MCAKNLKITNYARLKFK